MIYNPNLVDMKIKTIFTHLILAGFFLGSGIVFCQTENGQPKGDEKPDATETTGAESMSDSAKAALASNAALGKALFLGSTTLENGGPSCISCHNVGAEGMPDGGLLAKDLTHSFARLGEAGIPSILKSTPFPAMATAYANKPMTNEEVSQLTAFFQQVETTAVDGEPTVQHGTLLIGGSIGFVAWLGLIFGIYFKRKKESVKADIFKRQAR